MNVKWLERITWFTAGIMVTWYIMHFINDPGWTLNRHKGHITLVIGYDPKCSWHSQRLSHLSTDPKMDDWNDEEVITFRDFEKTVEARNRALSAAWSK